jgi:hypothetical protein
MAIPPFYIEEVKSCLYMGRISEKAGGLVVTCGRYRGKNCRYDLRLPVEAIGQRKRS